MSGRRNASYTFDADNRLVSLTIIQPDTSTSTSYYLYDSSGQRIYSKDVTMSSAGAILETRETYTISKNYSETYVNGVLKTKNAHIFAGDLMLATKEDETVPPGQGGMPAGQGGLMKYHLADHLGSTSVSTDTTGAIVELSDYFAYGSPRQSVQTNTSPEKRKYIGQEYDASTGLNYLNARYYNSAIGRFISQDPVFWEMSDSWFLDPQSQNSYSYARGNPIGFLDVSGTEPFTVAAAIVGLVLMIAPYAYLTYAFVRQGITGEQPDPLVVELAICTLNIGSSVSMAATAKVQPFTSGTIGEAKVATGNAPTSSTSKSVAKAETPTTKAAAETTKTSTPGTYRPNRTQERLEGGEYKPDTDVPHTALSTSTSSKKGVGNYTRAVEFGNKGETVRGIHFTDHNLPADHTNPHVEFKIPNGTGGTKSWSKRVGLYDPNPGICRKE